MITTETDNEPTTLKQLHGITKLLLKLGKCEQIKMQKDQE